MTRGRLEPIGTKKLFLALKGRRLATFLGLAAVAAALVQLIFGASLAVVALAIITAAAGLVGFVTLGAYNLGAWVALFYALGNVLVALYAKTLLGQPLDSYLYAPVGSFLALAVTSVGLLAALLLVQRVNVGRPLFTGTLNPRFLAFLSWACFGFGTLFWLLNRWFQDPSGSGFGGIALFRDLLVMAVIARTAMLLERSQCRGTFDIPLGLIVALSIFTGLIDNQKAMAALPVVGYFSTVLFYRRGLPMRSVVVLAIGVMLFATVIAPMTNALRALGQQEMSLNQRIEFVASSTAKLVTAPQELDRFEQLVTAQLQNDFRNYFGENGAEQLLLGRYASVQYVDPVIAAVNRQGTRGGSAIWPAFIALVPSFVYPDKPEYGEAYETLVYYDLINPTAGKYPVLPLAGQAYAGYGVVGLLVIPFLTFFGFLLVVKKLGWQLYRNVYAIFFFCSFVIVYVNQGDLSQYAGAALRNFPLFALVFWLITHSYRIRLRRRHLPAKRVRNEQIRISSRW
jgi:hypothetical protein